MCECMYEFSLRIVSSFFIDEKNTETHGGKTAGKLKPKKKKNQPSTEK